MNCKKCLTPDERKQIASLLEWVIDEQMSIVNRQTMFEIGINPDGIKNLVKKVKWEKSIYIETRFFKKSGKVKAKMHETHPGIKQSKAFNAYVDEFRTFDEWLETLEKECMYDTEQVVINLDAGQWVDITKYC